MIFTELIVDIAASAIQLFFGFLFGKFRVRKMRCMQNQDKLNYELNIGSSKFKSTTMPIYRVGYGLVGAICINVDYHYLGQEVRNIQKRLNDFLDSFFRTYMVLDENILSKNEYEKALAGKTHFRDA